MAREKWSPQGNRVNEWNGFDFILILPCFTYICSLHLMVDHPELLYEFKGPSPLYYTIPYHIAGPDILVPATIFLLTGDPTCGVLCTAPKYIEFRLKVPFPYFPHLVCCKVYARVTQMGKHFRPAGPLALQTIHLSQLDAS